MKYIVITARHHDGFAMFGSKASPFNIVDRTPFRRDPMKELAAACRKAGIRLCLYPGTGCSSTALASASTMPRALAQGVNLAFKPLTPQFRQARTSWH